MKLNGSAITLYIKNSKRNLKNDHLSGHSRFSVSHPKSWSSSEKSYALCLVELERNPILQASTKQPDDKFGKVLFAIRRIKDNN